MIPGWKEEIQRDYLEFLRQHHQVSPPEMAAHLNQSEGSIVYWLTDLAREGKIRILTVELVEGPALARDRSSASTAQRRAF